MIDACKKCRREGEKLLLKGERCLSPKCAVTRKPYAPGQHGQGFSKMSEYGRQLREKQKAKRVYGVAENQFKNYATLASKMTGNTSDNLITILESRADNVLYRLGFGASRSQSRQTISHGNTKVNGKKVTVPSILLKVGDTIELKNKNILEKNVHSNAPAWLTFDAKTGEGKVTHLASKEDVDTTINWNLIIEYYSK